MFRACDHLLHPVTPVLHPLIGEIEHPSLAHDFLFRAFAFLSPFLSKLFPWPDAWRKVFLNASNLLTAPRLCVFQDPAIPVRTIWHNPKDHWLRYKSTLFPREERKTIPDKRRPSSLFVLVEDSDRAWPLPT